MRQITNTVGPERGRLSAYLLSRIGKVDVVNHLVTFGLMVMIFAGAARAEVNGAGRYNADGPFAVATVVLTVPSPNGDFTTTAYIPKDSRPHPVVILASGFMQKGLAYAPYAKRLASWGIITFLQDDDALAYASAKAKFTDETSPHDNPAITEVAVKAISHQATTWLTQINAEKGPPPGHG